MGDEPVFPTWAYCNHSLFWVGEYWCCQDEGCGYRYWPVHAGASSPQANDAAEYHDDIPASESGAQDGNDLGAVMFGYGGTIPHNEWQGGHEPSSQRGQGAYQYTVPQYGAYQNAGQQNDDEDDNWFNNQRGDYQNGYQQNGRQPAPPSNVSATMGSRSSAGRTNSFASTETPDNEAASMAGHAEEDRVRSYIEGQPTVGMDAGSDRLNAFLEMGEFVNSLPGYDNGDAEYQDEFYPREVSLSDWSEPSVDQFESA